MFMLFLDNYNCIVEVHTAISILLATEHATKEDWKFVNSAAEQTELQNQTYA